MADAEKELEEVLLGVGNRILTPPSAVDDLLSLLDQAETLLSRVEQSPSQSMSGALDPSMKGLTAKELLGHPDADVKVSVASCISEITRITAPEAPYDDDLMKDIFRIIVQAFEKLDDMDSRSYSKRVSILETVAKVRSCVVMLDLECDALILEMFGHFLKTIRDNHPENVFSSMEMIMTVVVEESEDISSDLLSCLLVHVKKDNKDVSQIARRLVEKVIGNCASKLKPCLMETVRSLGTPLEGYSEIVASLCQGNSDVVGSHDLSISGKCLADDNRLSETTISDELPKGSGKREPEANHLEDVGAAADKSSKSSASSGAEQVVKKVEKSDAAAMDHSAKKARGKSSETTGASQAVKGREAAGLKSATTNGNKAEATHGRRPELEDGPEKSAVTSKSPDAARPKRGRPPGSKNSKNKIKTGVGASAPPSGSRMSSVESKEGGGAPSVDVRSRKQAEGPKRAAGSSDGVATPPGDLTGRLGRKRLVGKSGEGDVSERRRGSETKQRRSSKGEVSSPRKDSGAGVGEEVLVETPKAGSRKKRLRGTEEEQEGYDGSIVGAKIKVWWPDDRKFYRGVIDSYDPASMKHKVLYVDGDEEDLLLKNEVFKFLKDGGPARDDSTPAAGTGRSRKKAGKLPDAPPPTSPSSRKSKSEGMVSSNGGDSSSGRKKIAGRRGGGGSNGHGGRRPAADANGEPSGKKQRRS